VTRLTKVDEDNLREAIRALDAFLDPDNPRCSTPREVRVAAHIYLDSWVRGPLAEIIGAIEEPNRSIYNWRTGQTVNPRYRPANRQPR
jgi:hypothetical protein